MPVPPVAADSVAAVLSAAAEVEAFPEGAVALAAAEAAVFQAAPAVAVLVAGVERERSDLSCLIG